MLRAEEPLGMTVPAGLLGREGWADLKAGAVSANKVGSVQGVCRPHRHPSTTDAGQRRVHCPPSFL